jgi:hypothetical protein
MNKEFIPYEQALELKELGFNDLCLFYYGNNEALRIYHQSEIGEDLIGAPLYQQAFRWFREKYSINSWIINAEDNNNAFKPFFRGNNIDEHLVDFYNTYEEAELTCLKKLIEIVKNK